MLKDIFTSCPICTQTTASAVATFSDLEFVRCSDCTAIYKRREASDLRERLGRNYEAEYFKNGSAQYLKRWEHRVRKSERQLKMCLEFNDQAKDLLDVGCSAGYVLEAGKRLGLTSSGMDVSSFAINLVMERGFTAKVGRLEDMPFEDMSFDIVTAKHTIEHAEEPLNALTECRRVLRPNGVLLIVVPDAAYWKTYAAPRSGRYFVPSQLGWQHHVYYTAKALRLALDRSGFEVVASSKAVPVGTGLWRNLSFGAYALGTKLAELTHLRHELHFVAKRS